MTFYNESWFWMGIFTTFSALGATFIKEWVSGRSQAKLERLRRDESRLLAAYTKLYEFVSHARELLGPTDDQREGLSLLMKGPYLTIKPRMLLFPKDIRVILKEFECQYHCQRDSDFSPAVPFKDFMSKQIYEHFASLEKFVESRTDRILQKM